MTNFSDTTESEERFAFGKNWRGFLASLNDDRIEEAEKSLLEMMETDSLAGKTFLDIGSGSGLFSLAAHRLGARVHSFDYDTDSVACTRELHVRHAGSPDNWTVEQGSVLDDSYMESLGQFDIVYSWGVLHHTGQMWQALENSIARVGENGHYYIAIYNDQGIMSTFWKRVKRFYLKNLLTKALVLTLFFPPFFIYALSVGIFRHGHPWGYFSTYKKQRGMTVYYDWRDWLGGYPFEVARPEEILDFCRKRGFVLTQMRTTNGWGCNQFVFRKSQ